MTRFRPDQRRHVFVSGAGSDAAWLASISTALRHAGHEVWTQGDLQPGDNIVVAIESMLAAADDIVILLSKRSLESSWVRREIALAFSAPNKRVIPVLISANWEDLPPIFRDIQILDARHESSAGTVRELVNLIDGRGRPRRTESAELMELPPVGGRFFNRAAELSEIKRLFDVGPELPSPVIITGVAGVGKTALAHEYARVSSTKYTTIVWARSYDRSAVERAIIRASRAHSAEEGLRALSVQDRRSLVVLDDVTDYHDIADVLLPLGNIDYLVTSRRRDWGPLFPMIEVGGLDTATATAFLKEVMEESNGPGRDELPSPELVSAAGGIPYALSILGQLLRHRTQDSLVSEMRGIRTLVESVETGPGQYSLDSDDPRVISDFEAALVDMFRSQGLEAELLESEVGSWFRRFRSRLSDERADLLLDKAERAIEVVALSRPEGEANRDNAEAIARLMESSAGIPNAVVQSGSVLFVKVTDSTGARVLSKTLSATELRILETNEHVLRNPLAALSFLNNSDRSILGSPPEFDGGLSVVED